MPTQSRLHVDTLNRPTEMALLKSFERHLKAERKDTDTLAHYLGTVRQFAGFCERENLPGLANVTREHVELWLGKLHETYAPYSVLNRFNGLRVFFRWLLDEGEVMASPMQKMRPPSVEEAPKDIVAPQDMARLLAHLERQKRWRDLSVVAILYDCGLRASELANCLTEHANLDTGLIVLPTTKGDRVRVVHLSPKGVRWLDRYHRQSRPDPAYLINGRRGKLTRSGVYQIVRDAFREIGVKGTIGAHDLRHTSASRAVSYMTESEMLAFYGWKDASMVRHYAERAIREAALEAHRKASPLDRLPRP
jgi:site-specific recombinase XerD